MALRNIHEDIITALQNRDPLLTYHLIRFEKPSSLELGTRRVDFSYLTDAPYDVNFDHNNDNSVDVYRAGGVTKIGKVQEAIEARASKMSLTLSAVKLGATCIAQATMANTPSTLPAATSTGEGIAGLLTLDFDIFSAGFYTGDTITLTRTDLDGTTGEPLPFPKNTNFTGPAPTSITVRIDKIRGDGKVIEVTSLEKEGIAAFNHECEIEYVNPEVTTLTAKNLGSLSYESYVNRNVEIYRVFAQPDTGVIIGSPFLYFKGIIAQGTLNEKVDSTPTITWSLTSHWGDFVRVQGRLTSDEFHRGLDARGYSQVGAALKPEYIADFGFEHADKSLNVLAKYTGTESRLKSRRRGGLAGAFGGRKYSTEYYEVERQLDLRLNLESKHIPIVYGVQRIDSFPAFADIVITPDSTPGEVGSSTGGFTGGFTTMYSANVLCEGPISAIFDVFIDDETLVCKDKSDEDVRELSGIGNFQNNTSNKTGCIGLMEKGDVAGGQFFNEISSFSGGTIHSLGQFGGGYIVIGTQNNADGIPDVAYVGAAGSIQTELNSSYDPNDYASFRNQKGILHERSIGPLNQAKNLKLTFHAGKDNQTANKTLMNKAGGFGTGVPAFLGQQYYDSAGKDPYRYWGEGHRLLDTAYVVLEDKISDTDAQLPDISYVVKGKYVNCFNYDGSYRNTTTDDPNANSGKVSDFDLGDSVNIEPYYRNIGNAVAAYPATIIDKWFITDMDGELDFRFRFKAGNQNIFGVPGNNALNLTGSSAASTLETGDSVVYRTTSTEISPLKNGTKYFVVSATDSPTQSIPTSQIHLAETKEKALASTPVIITIPATTITGTHELELTFLDEQLINDEIKRFRVKKGTGLSNANKFFFCQSETFGGGSTVADTLVEHTSRGYVHNILSGFSNISIPIKRTVTLGKQIDGPTFQTDFGFSGNTTTVLGSSFPTDLIELYKDQVSQQQADAIAAAQAAGLTPPTFNPGAAMPVGDEYVYEFDFSNAPAAVKNLIRAVKFSPDAAKGIDFQVERRNVGGTGSPPTGGTTIAVSPYAGLSGWDRFVELYDETTNKLIIRGPNTDLNELFGAVTATRPTPGETVTVNGVPVQKEVVDTVSYTGFATLQFFQALVQDNSDTNDATTLDGSTITFKKDNIEDKTVGLSYPPSSAVDASGNNLNSTLAGSGYKILLLTEALNGDEHGGTSKYSYGNEAYEGSGIPNKSDRRVSNNPALQLLDYLRSKTYGKGLTDDLLNLESFREAARACDQQSKVTVISCPNDGPNDVPLPNVSVGDVYKYEANNTLFFQGTVENVETLTYGAPGETAKTYKQYTFTDVIGKLGRKWYSYTNYLAGEIVWSLAGNATVVGTSGTISQPGGTLPQATYDPASGIINRTSSISLSKVSGNPSSALAIDLNTNKIYGTTGNPIVKKISQEGTSLTSGYDLYDACEVRYWKYLGWEDRTQRFATRHQMNQTIDTSAPLFDNVNQMLTQFNGILRYSNGKYELDLKTKAKPLGEFHPLEKITTDKIIGDIKITDKGISKTFNSVTTGYIDPQNNFNSRNITFYNSTYKKEDKGISRQGQYKAPGITNYFNNRMNIKQMLDESRSGLTATFTGSPETYVLLPGNIIAITYERFNWEDKLFRILSMSPRDDLLVEFTVIEHNDNAFILDDLASDAVIGDYPEGSGFPAAEPIKPTGLTATNNKRGGIDLAWNNARNFRKETHIVEIWRGTHPSFSTSFPTFGTASEPQPHKLSRSNRTTDTVIEDGDNTFYYWIRYNLPANPGSQGLERFSNFFPSRTEPGISGVAGDNTGKVVTLFGPLVATYDALGNRTSAATFTYTARAFKFLDARFKFTFDGVADATYVAPTSGTELTKTINVPATFFTGTKDIKVEVQEGASGGTIAEFALSLSAVKETQTQKTVQLFNKQNNVNSTTFTVADPADQTYANPTNNIPSGWGLTQPSLTANLDVVFMVERIFTTDGLSPQQSSWSTPVIVARREDGTPGGPGPSGDDAIVMDLNNENHTIAADSTGAALTLAGATTTATIFEGNSDISNSYTFSSSATTGIGFSTSNGGRTITITSMANATNSGTVTITATRTNFPTKTAVFSLSKVNEGEDGTPATVFSLIINPKSIRKLEDGSFSPSSVSVSARKTVGTTNSAVTSSDGVTIRAFYDSSTNQFTSSSSGSLSVASSAYGTNTNAIRFEVTSSSNASIIHDSETVPIIPDGAEGDEGLRSVQGFLYYKKTGSNRNTAPSAPNGNTYTFSTGLVSATFPVVPPDVNTGTGNLSNTWQNQPQILDPSQLETIWVVRYYGTETTANSSTISVSYSTVVQYTNFTGVVTFSGGTLSSQTGGSVTPIEASDLGATGTTVIDGGRIDTDSLFARSISGDITETFSMGMDSSISTGGKRFTSGYSTLIDIPPPADISNANNTAKSLFGIATLTFTHDNAPFSASTSAGTANSPIEIYGQIEMVNGMDYEFTIPNLNQRTVTDSPNYYPLFGSSKFFESTTGRRVAIFSDNLLDNICHGGEIYYTSTQQARVDGVTFQRNATASVLQTRITYTNGTSYSNNNWSYIPNGSKWRLIPSTTSGLDQNRIGGRVYASGDDYVSLSLPWKLPKILHTKQTRLRFRVVNLHSNVTLRVTTVNVQAGFAR